VHSAERPSWDLKVKVQGHSESNMLENALFVHVTQHLENYITEFHQTFSINAFWDKDERLSFWDQKVKGQDHTITT